ncbi:hypothetical protein [Burkholderia cepacia]|uniref:hypothetical protein n=1 Tax=Burkholderia cepacia TaxID=292 RepID=UPI0012D86DC4|nr:hypothetical protein [Burkholderia cepacia]
MHDAGAIDARCGDERRCAAEQRTDTLKPIASACVLAILGQRAVAAARGIR